MDYERNKQGRINEKKKKGWFTYLGTEAVLFVNSNNIIQTKAVLILKL